MQKHLIDRRSSIAWKQRVAHSNDVTWSRHWMSCLMTAGKYFGDALGVLPTAYADFQNLVGLNERSGFRNAFAHGINNSSQ